ncbi:MAG TPA: hypothetical protein VNT01_08240 [Symbiobacteriaceae bacterium]|nr:hypothetical protein [Symbiobacteriaceae bacterium]
MGAVAFRPRSFIVTFLVTAIVSCLVLGLFNYLVNPLGWFAPRLVRPLAWGDQRIKVDLMKTAQPSEVLVLGSSRVSKLAPADIRDLSGMRPFLAGVSSSRPEEQYAMLRYALDDLHWPVKEIIYGIDLETLFYAGPPNEDVASSPEVRQYVPREMWLPEVFARVKLLVSSYNLGLSAKALRLDLTGSAPPSEVAFDADGYLHYITMEKQVAAGTFRLNAEGNLANYQERYNVAPSFDPQRKALFEQTLALAQARGIKVRLFATPFHPALLAGLQQAPAFGPVRAAALPYLERLADRYPNVTFHDFTEVASFGGDPNAFFDGVHYRQENGRLMLAKLYQQ